MVEMTASCVGIPYAASAMTKADTNALIADTHAGFRSTPSMTKSTTIGIAATTADTPRLPAMGS